MTLHQIHYQPKNYKESHKTNFVEQKEVETAKQLEEWINDVMKDCSIPDGYQILIVAEDSHYFMKCTG